MGRAAEVRADLERLEAEAAAPLQRWILDAATPEPPQLSSAAQTALDEARRAAERAQRDARAAEALLPGLHRQHAELRVLAHEIEQRLRQAALQLLADRHIDAAVATALEAERAAATACERAYALLQFFHGAGYRASVPQTAEDRLGNPVSVVMRRSEIALKSLAAAREAKPDPALIENHITTLRTELEQLERGEE